MATEVGTPMNRRGVTGFQDPQSLQDMSKTNKCAKLTQIGNWQRALREFMQSDARLSDLVSLYGQKFVQLGENKNFTLSTLTDMVWTVLVLTWEAILDNKLPLVGEADAGYYKRYQDLQKRFNQCREEWLKEVSNMRDQKRSKQWSDGMQAAFDTSMEHDIFTFVPENALDDDTREYFKLSMQENMKMALVKGAAAAGEQSQFLAKKLQRAEEELVDAQMQLEMKEGELLKLQGDLYEAQEDSKAAGREKKKEIVKVERVESKNVSEVNALRQDKEALEEKMDKLREKLRALGFEGDIDDDLSPEAIEAIKKRWTEFGGGSAAAQQGRMQRGSTMDVAEAVHKEKEAEKESAKLRQALAEAEERTRKLEAERDESRAELTETKRMTVQLEKEATLSKKKAEEAEKVTKQAGAKGKAAEKAAAAAAAAAEEEAKRKEEERIEKEVEKKLKKAAAAKAAETKVPTRSVGVGDHSVLEEKKPGGGEKEIVYVEKIVEGPGGPAAAASAVAAAEAAIAAEVEKRLEKEIKEKEKKEVEKKEKEKREKEKKMKEEEEAEHASEEVKQRRKEELAARKAKEAEMEAALAATGDAEAYGRSMEKKNSKLEAQLEESRESEEKLKRKVNKMSDEINEARDVRKKLEMSLAELNKKFQDLKYQLMDKGIDTAVIEEAMNDCGLEKIISGPVINVFDRLYHDAMKRSTRVSVVKNKEPPPDPRAAWNRRRRSLIRGSAAMMLAASQQHQGERSDSSESSSADSDKEAYSIFGGKGRHRKEAIPHLDGGNVLVRELGSAEIFTVKAATAHLWTRPELSASKTYKASLGTEVVGVPYEVGGVRWLLVYSVRTKDWNPAAEADEAPHGAYWSLIDGGPVDITHDILVPVRVSSAPRERPIVEAPVEVGEQSPWSTMKTWTPVAESAPPSGLDRFKKKTWAMAHILGATKKAGGAKGMKGGLAPSSKAKPDGFTGVQGVSVISLVESNPVDEFGNPIIGGDRSRAAAGNRSRSGSRSPSRSGSGSRSASGSGSASKGSRAGSRERVPFAPGPGRSQSPLAQRAAEASRIFAEAQGTGTADARAATSGAATLVSLAGRDHERPRLSVTAPELRGMLEPPRGWVAQTGWPYRSPRRSMVAGMFSTIDDSELAMLGEQREESSGRDGRAVSPYGGAPLSPGGRSRRQLSPNSETLAQHNEATGSSPRTRSRSDLREFIERGIDKVIERGGSDATQALLSGQGRKGSPTRESLAADVADAGGRTTSQSSRSPNRGTIFNFTELDQGSPRQSKLLARIPVAASQASGGSPKNEQAQRGGKSPTPGPSRLHTQLGQNDLSVSIQSRPTSQQSPSRFNMEFGQNDPSVSIQSRQGLPGAKLRAGGVANERTAGTAIERTTPPTASELLASASQASAKPRTAGAGGTASEHTAGGASELLGSGLGSGQAKPRTLVGAAPGWQTLSSVDLRVRDAQGAGEIDKEFPQRDSKFSIAKAGSSANPVDPAGGPALPAVLGSSQAAGTKKRGLAMESLEAASDSAQRQAADGANRRTPSTGSVTGGSRSRPIRFPGQGLDPHTAPGGFCDPARPGSRGTDSGRPGSRGDDPSRPVSRGGEVFDIVARQAPLASAQGGSNRRRPGRELSSMTDATAAPQGAGAADLPLQRRLSNGTTLPQGRYLGGRSSESGLIGSASAPGLLERDSSGNAAGGPSSGAAEGSHADDSSEFSQMTFIHAPSSGVPAGGTASCRLATTGDPWALVEMDQKSDVKFLPPVPVNSTSPGSLRQMGGAKMTGKIFTGAHRVQQMRESESIKSQRRLVGEGQSPTTVFSRGRDPSTRKLFLLKGAPAHDPGRPPGTPPG